MHEYHYEPHLQLEQVTAVCRVLATGFPKGDHVSNGITIAHMIAFGKTSCKNSANRCNNSLHSEEFTGT